VATGGGAMVEPRTPVPLKWGISGSDGGTHKKNTRPLPGGGARERRTGRRTGEGVGVVDGPRLWRRPLPPGCGGRRGDGGGATRRVQPTFPFDILILGVGGFDGINLYVSQLGLDIRGGFFREEDSGASISRGER